jgi:hypothetical protein
MAEAKAGCEKHSPWMYDLCVDCHPELRNAKWEREKVGGLPEPIKFGLPEPITARR